MKTAILLLGAPNDECGNLSSIALERCNQALAESIKNPEAYILCTGGFGAHFNTTNKPHAFYTRSYLIGEGVLETRFLPSAESGNTIEDAKIAAPILDANGTEKVILVTSDFHTERAMLLVSRHLNPQIIIEPSPAKTNLPEEELEKLRAHETQAIARLKEQM